MSSSKKSENIKHDLPPQHGQDIQKELTESIHHLNKNLKTLDRTLNLIKEHEFVEFHKSKWKIFAREILLGVLFAVGTVCGLILLSWLSYHFFKDSQILRDIVDSQLKMRKLDINEIRGRVLQETKFPTASGATGSGGK